MVTENLPAGLFLGEARMLTIILKGSVETQSLKTTAMGHLRLQKRYQNSDTLVAT